MPHLSSWDWQFHLIQSSPATFILLQMKILWLKKKSYLAYVLPIPLLIDTLVMTSENLHDSFSPFSLGNRDNAQEKKCDRMKARMARPLHHQWFCQGTEGPFQPSFQHLPSVAAVWKEPGLSNRKSHPTGQSISLPVLSRKFYCHTLMTIWWYIIYVCVHS